MRASLRRGPARAALAAALVSAGAALAIPAPAHGAGGQYLLQVGRLSSGASTGVDPADVLYGLTVNGGAGGSFGVDPEVTAGTNSETFGFSRPTGVSVQRADVWAAMTIYGSPALGAWGDIATPWGPHGYSIGQTDWTYDHRMSIGGAPLSVLEPGSVAVSATITNGGSGSGSGARARFVADKLDLYLSDGEGPVLDGVPAANALFGAANPSGWYTAASGDLVANVHDVGSGVRYLLVREGASVSRHPVSPGSPTCRTFDTGQLGGDSYTVAQPCPVDAAAYTVPVDLAAMGDGAHTLEIGVQDAAGNTAFSATQYVVAVNAPGGTLTDPGTPCVNGTFDDAGQCIVRAPANTNLPELSGTPTVGFSLVTDDGAWDDIAGATWAYAWEHCAADGTGCVPIDGERASTVTLAPAHAGRRIRSVVTATTSGGTVQARSGLSPIVETPSGSGGSGAAGGVRDVPARGGGGGGSGAPGSARPAADVDDLPVPPAAVPGGVAVVGPNGVGADETTPLLDVSVRGGRRATVVRRYAAGATVVGRLQTAGGSPIRRAQIDVIGQGTTSDARPRILGAVRTGDDGGFRYTVAAGPSLVVTFGYRRTLADRAYSATGAVRALTRAAVSLRAGGSEVRNGGTLLLRGRVSGAPATSRRLVSLQAFARGRWTTFATTRLRRGAFAYRYRFTRTARTTRYQVRAVVTRDARWPFETGASRPVTVTVVA